MIDECITWKDHIRTVERKIAKNIGILYRAKQFLNTSSLKSIYFSYTHTYLTYANIAWASTQKTKLKMININQKHAVRMFNEDRFCHPPVFSIKKSLLVSKKARIKILARAIYTYLMFFLYIHSPLLLENKKLLWSLFSPTNSTTDHCSIICITRLF